MADGSTMAREGAEAKNPASAPPPIPCVWDGRVFRPLPSFGNIAGAHYGEGEIVALAPVEERSAKSHAHYFAVINETWKNLSEDQLAEFPTPDALRKKALISVGWRDERTIVCSSRAEALRVAAFMRPIDDTAVVSVSGATVVYLTAKSQSMRAQGKQSFAEVKERVFDVLAELIGTDPATLGKQAAAA